MSSSPDGTVDESSALEPSGHDPADRTAEPRCYRCDRPLEDERWIRLDARPGSGVADAYERVSRACCPDCVAGIGLLEIAVDPSSSGAD
ncbi:hypothetical protein [Natrarchaeobius oligotrophus]|uniref:Uncharacterized protein n=1 Tax=Natrarchaeobius chitinivorans TaxID=1679083 RepID=A0A3N6M102_NATCH|nr:hypothetical protein [Natrarchaeobius chitinivorans]RQG95297.1 hypothetical protein EA472_21680 [Natrarchaeobius chitinivorans]